MPRKIFLNLPVADLDRAMSFFTAVGFTFNKQFTDASAACMVIDEHIHAMLVTHARVKDFTPKAIADARQTTEVLIALSADTKAEVDAMVEKALKAGATPTRPPADHGFMYERSFDDLDGHIWEIFWMDPAAVQQA